MEHVFLFLTPPDLGAGRSRTERFLRVIEQKLRVEHGWYTLNDQARPIRVSSPASFLSEALAVDAEREINNGNEGELVSVRADCDWGGGRGEHLASYALDVPYETPAALLWEVLRDAGDALEAWWAECAGGAAGLAAKQMHAASPDEIPYGLPPLVRSEELVSDAVPGFIGWFNYWSNESLRLLGVDDVANLEPHFYRVQRTRRGVALMLTKDVLDLEVPDHVRVLKSAYEAVSGVGRLVAVPGESP